MCVALVAFSAPAARAAAVLAVGVYEINLVVSGVKITKGKTCALNVGEDHVFWVEYPGAGNAGAKLRLQSPSTSTHYEVLGNLPKTPTTGVTKWAGPVPFSLQPGNVAHWTSTFSQTLDIIDTHSFAGVMTLGNYPNYDGSICTVTLNDVGVFSGPL
jgi:hypothetical protein